MTKKMVNRLFANKLFLVVGLFLALGLVLVFLIGKVDRAEGAKSYSMSSTSTEHWAWNDLIGWIDFNYDNDINPNFCGDNIESSACLSSDELSGSASSSAGLIYLNCADHPKGCSSPNPNFKVTNFDKRGTLAYDAWNDAFGWFSFHYLPTHSYFVVAQSRYGDDTPPSDFSGWAWNPVVGWVSFSCADLGYCGTVDYKVTTNWYTSSTSGWLESATYDTGSEGGARFNSISFRGYIPVGTRLSFYFAASSTSDGPWNYQGPFTPDFIPSGDLFSVPLDYALFEEARYFRYKVVLFSNSLQTISPRVDEVVVNWSP